jgi:hypothetical protein
MKTTTSAQSPSSTCSPYLRRQRHGFGKSRTRFWLRHNGKILRFLCITDYSVCDAEHHPRTWFKRITHRRFRPGSHLLRGHYTPGMTQWYADLPADQWVEVI